MSFARGPSGVPHRGPADGVPVLTAMQLHLMGAISDRRLLQMLGYTADQMQRVEAALGRAL